MPSKGGVEPRWRFLTSCLWLFTLLFSLVPGSGQLTPASDPPGVKEPAVVVDSALAELSEQVARLDGRLETLMWGLGILAIVLLGALGKVITQTANLQKAIADQNTVFKTALTEEARNLEKSVYDQAIAVQKSLGDHNAALQRVEATLIERVRNLRQAASGGSGV
jgi:hypothetical protein